MTNDEMINEEMTDSKKDTFFVICNLSFVIFAFLLRLIPLGRYVTPDEPMWVYRAIGFADALAARDWTAIPSSGHPGVTTMWLGAAGIALRRLLDPIESAMHLEWIRSLVWAGGYLHDLGKLAVPLRILAKPGHLDEGERRWVRSHPAFGADVLEGIPVLSPLGPAARYHHERWDGRGYPDGLGGDVIPLEAQVLSVADAYDAMTTSRAYRSSLSHHAALEEIGREAGRQFAPEVARAFLALPEAIFRTAGGVARPRPHPLRDPRSRVAREAWLCS